MHVDVSEAANRPPSKHAPFEIVFDQGMSESKFRGTPCQYICNTIGEHGFPV